MSRVVKITGKNGVTLQTKDKIIDDDIAIQVDGAENITANNIKSGVTILGVSGNMATVVANPTLDGGESDLTSVEIEGTKYAIPSGTEVIANPTLSGNEETLEGAEIDGVKYKVGGSGGGSKTYFHRITLPYKNNNYYFSFVIISKKDSAYTYDEILAWLNSLRTGAGWSGGVPVSASNIDATTFPTSVSYNNDGWITVFYWNGTKIVREFLNNKRITIYDNYIEV